LVSELIIQPVSENGALLNHKIMPAHVIEEAIPHLLNIIKRGSGLVALMDAVIELAPEADLGEIAEVMEQLRHAVNRMK
jgi:hypothetical protein